ncbi:MAG: deoxyribonuclease IV [Clostridia bacterium]|nr:deoxyribonuclease IV [Clostridia bacterium]
MRETRIGCHLSLSGGFAGMAKTAVSLEATTFQFFSANPRGGKSREWARADIEEMLRICREHGIGGLVAHAPYILNPCSSDPEKRKLAWERMEEDMKRLQAIPGCMYNLHPGCHTGQGTEEGMREVAELLRRLAPYTAANPVLLETMAGKGTELGSRFSELGEILRMASVPGTGVCLDTCHVWDAGYDIQGGLEAVLEAFDREIGLERLLAIHLNDSKNARGSHRDRHEKLGQGEIGLKALLAVTSHPALRGLPFILETPNEAEGYAAEIRLVHGDASC